MGIEAEQCGDLLITTVAQQQRLKPGIQTALLLIEQAEKQYDGSLGLRGYSLRLRGAARPGRQGLEHASRQELLLAQRRVGGTIQKSMGQRFACQAALRDQLEQGSLLRRPSPAWSR